MKIVKWWTSLDPEHHFAAPKQAPRSRPASRLGRFWDAAVPVEIAGTFFLGSFHGSIKSSILEVQLILVLLLTDRGWRIGSAHSTMVLFYRDLVSGDLATCCGVALLRCCELLILLRAQLG